MDNRSTILARAMELFASRGYDAAGVQEIVDAAGVTKPTLYHYFGNKQGLLRALLTEYNERLNAAARAAAEYKGDLPLTLRRLARTYFRFADENRIYYKMLLSMFFAPTDSDAFKETADINHTQFSMIEELFARAAHDHGNMKDRQKLYAASFLGMIHNCIGLALNGYLVLNDVLLERAVHQFEHGIYS